MPAMFLSHSFNTFNVYLFFYFPPSHTNYGSKVMYHFCCTTTISCNNKKAQLMLPNPCDAKPCQKFLQF